MKFFLAAFLLFNIGFSQQRAKFEPDSGCYVGAFIMNDTLIKGNVDQFEYLTGKDHSMYFSYAAYGQPFPASWVNYYAGKGAAVQIAFEPNNGLAEVTDSEYLREWARGARQSGAMIFLRWASEMNGNWVAWYGNPALYIEKFRLVYNIFKEEAPNVSLVWAPNDVPNDPNSPPNYVHSYYPGDAYVDWVGIDFYGVYFYENGTPERVDPRNKLRVVYNTYSQRKPVMICEWAATHYSTRVTPPVNATPYCIEQMNLLYNNVKTEFPKLKAICWFDMNSLTTNKCNYCITENSLVLNNYKNIMENSYFLTTPVRNVPVVEYINFANDTVLRNNVEFTVNIKCDRPIDSVVAFAGKYLLGKRTTLPYSFNINNIPDGKYKLVTRAYSSSGFSNYESVNIIIDKGNNYVNYTIDDSSSEFQTLGNWTVSTSQPDRFGQYYHVTSSGNGSNKAFWNPGAIKSGYYSLYAFWSAHSNRASLAPFVILRGNKKDTVKVNQRINGGKWNLLGVYSIVSAEINKVELNNNADGYVVADAVRFEWEFPATSIEENNFSEGPSDFDLFQNYPNPFNSSTKIEFRITGNKPVFLTLKVYNVLGQLVTTLAEGFYNPGKNFITWESGKNSAGVYFAELVSANAAETAKRQKMILLR